MLPRNAKLYITIVTASGCAVLMLAAKSWSFGSLKQFAIYLGLTALASTLKIKIPSVESTITPNFILLLVAMHACQFSEVVAISLVAALIQSLWRSSKRPRLVQLTFSAAALVVSAAAAYQISHGLLAGNTWDVSSASVILAGCIYFPLNSALVAVVIGLVSGQSIRQILGNCDAWAFPYFMGGIAFAALVATGFNQSSSWKGALILIPVVILAHFYFRNRSGQNLAPHASA
jgi:hypothetical protein